MPRKIISDTDPGVDDAMAILFALKSPEIELVGLTTIFGNVYTDLATQNALRAEFIYQISLFYRDFHYADYDLAGMHTHDPSAIAYVLDPTLFTTERGPVRVVTEGIAIGQTLLDRRQHWHSLNAWSNKPQVNVCLAVDSKRLLALYREKITR